MEENFKDEPKIEEKQVKKIKLNKIHIWQIISVIFIALFLISLFKPFSSGVSGNTVKSTIEELSGANVLSIEKENGLYKIQVKDDQGNEGIIYMSMDGELLLQGAIQVEKLREYVNSVKDTTGGAVQEVKEYPKTEKPSVKLFVMSQCPYGLLAESVIAPVLTLLKNKIDFTLNYIADETAEGFNSLHGQVEVDEDLRQLCINKYYPEKLFNYLDCVNKDIRNVANIWEKCAADNGIDVEKIKNCASTTDGKALLKNSIAETEKYQVTGSPTLIINDVNYNGARTPDAYKASICSAFTKVPEECSQTLSTTSETASGNC